VWSLPDTPKQRVRAELLNTYTAGTDTNTLTTFTLLLVIRTQHYLWSLDKVGCTAKSSQQSFCHWWENIHHHLTNLQNHITTNILDVVRIITSKQQIFSVRSSPDPAKIGFSPHLVLIRAHLCSVRGAEKMYTAEGVPFPNVRSIQVWFPGARQHITFWTLTRDSLRLTTYRVFHNCWNKAAASKTFIDDLIHFSLSRLS